MTTVTAERPRILATDDRPDMLRIIERTLGELYDCEFADSVEVAREKLATGEYQVALCDIEMPGESGLVLVEELGAEHPDTAVLLVTGIDDPAVAKRAFELGAHGYLVKPFFPGQLLITVMTALRRRELEIAQRAHSHTLEQRIQVLMDRAPVPIYIKDRELRYLIANRVAHEVAGMGPNQLIGLTDTAFMSPGSASQVHATDSRVLDSGEALEIEETVHVGDHERTFLSVKFPYVDDSGAVAGISGVSADITDKRRAEDLQRELGVAQAQAIEELRASRQETVERLARAIEMHDAETGVHVHRMASTAALLAGLLGLEREQVLLLRAAAPMHDVGKIATPDRILRKAGPLNAEERTVMEQHTVVGNEILAGSDSDLLQMGARIALSHHERFDGGGYPHGIEGEEIPLEARIVAVADVFDALLSDRPYRKAMTVAEAAGIIYKGRGTHFDPTVVDALLDNLELALELRG
ncbi:MAG TPA: HD domain-containing phosphohydrolase [Solirubrobacterales bacterium]|jgi:PAS domain S-box-containing protein|nr:HD domain-containing phosphohydrolase [Solirubrobacterales bacterium]